ncbi:Xenobiotic-transporting ATPase [Syntrophobotulus glycolicus DSM 8271]|uniref:Xenobiotic-transporting ATPase n=1 Tax=Syntrophobotulus glycolicus (strain DSM 8271 / FlGlyR) TaxID=645991 RepID=F0SXP2_SYNGF|nr:ABC transporter ATP-binding protein [Syntrophobotulus glycolicus]ADY55875.1 Xenobiotic-transporting ATPase [Syntrophobotulus glycolicus DSM 8271]
MLRMIGRILEIAGDSKPRIILGIVFNFFKTVSMAMMLLAVFLVFEHLEALTPDVIYQALWIIIVSVCGRFLFQWLMDISMSAKGFDMFRDYRLAVGEKLKGAPMGYFSEQRLGTIQSILTSTVVELEQYSMMAIMDITGGVSMAVVIIVMMAFYSLPIALLSLAGLIIGLFVLHVIQKRAAIHTVKVQAAQENLVTESLEYIRGIAVLRAFLQDRGGEGAVYRAFEDRRQAAYDQEHAAAGVMKLYSLVFKLTSCALLFLATALYLTGAFPLSYCLMFLVSAFLVYAELEVMGDGAYLARKVNNELDRLETVTDIPSLDRTARELRAVSSDIEMKEVSFAYDSRTVIDHVSLKVPQGTSCAIVGPSGSGKTTLCNLIARFWDVQEGEVLVGGQNVKDCTADSLLSQISMVFQNVYLFHDTVENNIRFGNPDASHEQVVEAAKRACCHEFITALPEGYDTIVGEGGSTLSGGERQRISIARAILKNAPIVILDEATSSVDPENEHVLLTAIYELTRGKTLIAIAHRLSTVRKADQILVVDKGKIVQKGTHAQLVQEDGIYRKFLRLRSESIGWQL